MPKKAAGPPRIAPLQRVIAEPITDPAEQAALDALRRRKKGKQKGQKAETTRDHARAASSPAVKRRG
jgi:hypothetical protein